MVLQMAYGNIFQEYNQKKPTQQGKIYITVSFMWVVATMVLSMSFVGNLKSILMKKDFETTTATREEIVDKDMRILMPKEMEAIMEAYSNHNNIDERILCQTRKTKGFYNVG